MQRVKKRRECLSNSPFLKLWDRRKNRTCRCVISFLFRTRSLTEPMGVTSEPWITAVQWIWICLWKCVLFIIRICRLPTSDNQERLISVQLDGEPTLRSWGNYFRPPLAIDDLTFAVLSKLTLETAFAKWPVAGTAGQLYIPQPMILWRYVVVTHRDPCNRGRVVDWLRPPFGENSRWCPGMLCGRLNLVSRTSEGCRGVVAQERW